MKIKLIAVVLLGTEVFGVGVIRSASTIQKKDAPYKDRLKWSQKKLSYFLVGSRQIGVSCTGLCQGVLRTFLSRYGLSGNLWKRICLLGLHTTIPLKSIGWLNSQIVAPFLRSEIIWFSRASAYLHTRFRFNQR